MADDATHALVAETYVGSFSVAQGSKEEMKTEFKKWWTKIFNTKRKKINMPDPNNLPVSFTPAMFLGLRVVEIPPQMRRAVQMMNDPRYRDFVDRANQFGSSFENPNSTAPAGVDLLDQGRK